jgi:methylamine---glutamate N-methyltransferase subunit B
VEPLKHVEPLTVDRSGLDEGLHDAPQRHAASLDCAVLGTRGVNRALQAMPDAGEARILQPRGRHNLAVGVADEVDITVEGNAGYFLGGQCGRRGGTGPHIVVNGFVGWSVAENLMGGVIRVRGSASQSAGSSARGGHIFIGGDASLRAGISLKGAKLAIAGDAGPMTGFMAQAGTILIGGDAGHALGDSLYEAVIYVQGAIASLGADAVVEDLSDDDVLTVKRLVEAAGFDHIEAENVTRVVSARELYHFSSRNHTAY